MSELKPGWRRLKLGDVVDVITEYWDRDPATTERFVAGEHINEGSLLVSRWGLTSDDLVPPTFNRRFRAGDVLFHSRNLKKLARPDFDGITGEKLFVLRSRDASHLLPDLLPHLLQAKAFDEYVNRMWAGSTNKFLNKSPLLNYEFALPPLEEQVRLVGLLNVAQRTVESLSALLQTHGTLRISVAGSLLSEHSPTSVPEVHLKSACARIGVGIASSVSHAYRDSGVPIIRNTDIKNGQIRVAGMLFVDPSFSELHRTKKVRAGDVVMTRTATDVPGDAAVVPEALDGAQTFTTLICSPNPAVLDSEYLSHWINSTPGRVYIRSRRGGAKQQNLGATFLGEMPIRLPPIKRQQEIARNLAEVERMHAEIATRHENARQLLQTLQTEQLGP